MTRKTLKAAALAAVLGTVFGFGGCLGQGAVRWVLINTASYTGLEFLLDDNAVFDLFQDSQAG
jgi:hypothetical protein